jgi:hypothetical protein
MKKDLRVGLTMARQSLLMMARKILLPGTVLCAAIVRCRRPAPFPGVIAGRHCPQRGRPGGLRAEL